MSDYSRLLISKILIERDILPAMEAGICPTWFEDSEHRRAYKWMVSYFNRYGSSPTIRALKTEFPTYRVKRAEEPYDYYLDHFREQRRRAILVDAIIETDEALREGDSATAQAGLSKGLIRLGREVTSLTDEDLSVDVKGRYRAYGKSRHQRNELVGIATGYPTLDMVTGGYQSQQFVLFGGQAKNGKSFLLMKSAMAAQEAGKKVLFLSFEMSVHEQKVRYDALACGVNSLNVLNRTLTAEDMKKLRQGMRLRRNLASFIVSADITATTTISGLTAKVEQHRPDIVFIDGVYLMDNEEGYEPQSPQAYTTISRGLKRLAQRVEKPVIGTTQALSSKMPKDGSVTLHSLGWTSAWSQDADLIMGVERVDGAPLIRLRVVAGRNVSPRVIAIGCNWDESILEEIELDEEEDDE